MTLKEGPVRNTAHLADVSSGTLTSASIGKLSGEICDRESQCINSCTERDIISTDAVYKPLITNV